MPQFDIATFPTQIFWLAVSFIVLYILMSRIALPRVGSVLEERQTRIDDNLSLAEQLNAEAKSEAEAYENSLIDARAKARAVIQEVTQDAANEAQRRHDTLGEELTTKVKSAETRIKQAKETAIDGVREAARDVTATTVQHLIQVSPSPDAVTQAVDEALKETEIGK